MTKTTSFISEPFLNIKSILYKKKNDVYYFQIFFSLQRYSSFRNRVCKLPICPTKFWSNMIKKDISANLYQKCLNLCSKIALNVLHNTNSTVLLPWQHSGFQTSPILKSFLATGGIPLWYLLMVPGGFERKVVLLKGILQKSYCWKTDDWHWMTNAWVMKTDVPLFQLFSLLIAMTQLPSKAST